MAAPIAVIDACVLYSAPIRDLLVHLALEGVFKARWTEAIHDEWISALLKHRPDLDNSRLLRTRNLLDTAIPDAAVFGYESLIGSFTLPDDNDRHVVAAAIKAGASRILTFNLNDFPKLVLDGFAISAIHPDEFVASLILSNPRSCCLAART